MKVAIYLRVSTEEQVQHGFSLKEQRVACTQRALGLGAASIVEYKDEGISGAILDRPGLTALRTAVQQKAVGVVIIRDPDRLARRLAHQLLITEELEKAGVRLEFLDFTWQDTPDGRLFYAIRGAIAEYEKEKIRERMLRGKMQKAREGGIPMGFYNYGYGYTPQSGQVKVEATEAGVVRDIFKWFTEEDLSLNGVAKRLNARGIPSRHRKLWHRQVIKQILENPVYKGFWRYKDVFIPVPALLEPGLWEAAQKKLKMIRQLYAGNRRNYYFLSGLMFCGDCGNSLTGLSLYWWGKKERHYTCRKKHAGATNYGCRPGKYLPASVLEGLVWAQVVTWLQDAKPRLKEGVLRRPWAGQAAEEEVRIENDLHRIDTGRRALIQALGEGLLDLDSFTQEKLLQLGKRKASLEKRKTTLIQQRQLAEHAVSRPEELEKGVQAALAALQDGEKRAFVRALIKQINVFGRDGLSPIAAGSGFRLVLIARLAKDEA